MDEGPSQSNGFAAIEDEVTALRKERDELVITIDEMRRCIAEYDRSLQHLIDEKSQSQPQVNVSVADLISERDQAVEEVATIEKAFGDLHRRFEKSKQVIESFKQNEEALKHSIEEYKSLLQRQENKYLALKKLAEDKLLKATQDAEAQRQEFESSATRLQAALRIAELQTKSLETQLAQKTRENVELTKICDELLSKYGGLS
ncbi:Transforming acidic coiled-coil-containing protein 2 [Fasciola gigantica]|uniref:Transforming acidic coiled-coil-containing protein 2 n=1 Tax=Fasciola gigantica TaxID=46835 RepID=A0A504Y7G8_FASGI|nr:Transforming acidic coiled-coil-containing protein 2 [Fasciola gigantica]